MFWNNKIQIIFVPSNTNKKNCCPSRVYLPYVFDDHFYDAGGLL